MTDEIERLKAIAIERMELFKQAAIKVEQANAILSAFVAAYEKQDADGFTDAMRDAYSRAESFLTIG